ncbi:MAG: glycosyltransferase family 39 protein [Clostridia bacterium]|nr:glycosyltransferase family 39 protein [Clostridia bacterium]
MGMVSTGLFLPITIILLIVAFWGKKKEKHACDVQDKLGKWYWVLFAACMAMGIFTRVYRFCDLPKGTNHDGIMGAVQAFYLMRDGVDTSGFSWPTYFEAWKYTNMSTLYSWILIPFLSLFGNTVFALRLPMLIISLLMLPLVWHLGVKLAGKIFGLILLFVVATNPWHILQSRWAIDANLMPHVFLIGFYFLYLGIEKRPFLYLSMVFFGLTVYAYGQAAILMPIFLLPAAVYLVSRKKIPVLDLIVCILLFLAVSGLYYWTMAINALGLETVHIGRITLPYLALSHRSSDIAFANKDGIFSIADGLTGLLGILLETNRFADPYDAIPWAYTMYRFTAVLYLFGFFYLWIRRRDEIRKNLDMPFRTSSILIMMWFLAAVLTAAQIVMNVMRFNYVFYSLMLLLAVTIYEMGKRIPWTAMGVIGMIFISFICLNVTYFTDEEYQNEVGLNFRYGFFNALKDTWGWDYDEYVIGVQSETDRKQSEPHVLYAHEIDYQAQNEETDLVGADGNPTDWYYTERYVYVTDPETYEPDPMACNVYVMRQKEYRDKFSEEDFLITDYDMYFVAYPRYWAE